MAPQKYKVGETVFLREGGGKEFRLFKVEIMDFEGERPKSYIIRYQKNGDLTFWIEDVEADRLFSQSEIAAENQ